MQDTHVHDLLITSCMSFNRNTAAGYTTCPIEQDGDKCSVTFTAAFHNPIIFYIIWQAFYFTWVSQILITLTNLSSLQHDTFTL